MTKESEFGRMYLFRVYFADDEIEVWAFNAEHALTRVGPRVPMMYERVYG